MAETEIPQQTPQSRDSVETEFDEDAYLKTNADVASAVRRSEWDSGLAHFNALGRSESRPLGRRRVQATRWRSASDHPTEAPVISEAWMFKRPVIVSNIGATRERITREVDGPLFHAGDPQSLAQVLRRATTDEALWNPGGFGSGGWIVYAVE